MFLYLKHAYEVKYFDLCFTHAELRHRMIKYLTQSCAGNLWERQLWYQQHLCSSSVS